MQTTVIEPFYPKLKTKLVDFAGWKMPVWFTSTLDEHKFVRSSCGVFDVSHMGRIILSGSNVVDFLENLLPSNISEINIGASKYTALLNKSGGIIDDLIIYRLKDLSYMLCVNASNAENVLSWINQQENASEIQIKNLSTTYAQLAVQGPTSLEHIQKILPSFRPIHFGEISSHNVDEGTCYVARTGYTGEHGYEIYTPNSHGIKIWGQLLNNGVHPCGLGARDTLRLEAGYSLYGSELNTERNIFESGIGWISKTKTQPHIGMIEKENQKSKIRAFTMVDSGIPRSGMSVIIGDEPVGIVTSGGRLPSLEKNGGLLFFENGAPKVGTEIFIDIRGKRKLAIIQKKPLYSNRIQ